MMVYIHCILCDVRHFAVSFIPKDSGVTIFRQLYVIYTLVTTLLVLLFADVCRISIIGVYRFAYIVYYYNTGVRISDSFESGRFCYLFILRLSDCEKTSNVKKLCTSKNNSAINRIHSYYETSVIPLTPYTAHISNI